jgi:hypothetical protein
MAVDRTLGLGFVLRPDKARADVAAAAGGDLIAANVSTKAHAHDLFP